MLNINDKLKLGIVLPTREILLPGHQGSSIETILSMADITESAGLDSIWVGDSITAKPRLEPITTLAAIASRTKRIRLGTAVLLAALRNPIALSQAIATLDTIAPGRAILGAGIGGAFNDSQRQEWINLGIEVSTRAKRFEEVLEITKYLMTGKKVNYSGNHFNLDDVSVLPKPDGSNGTPILIACHWNTHKDIQFQRAARIGNGFISISDYPHEYGLLCNKVKEYTEQFGRNYNDMESAFYMTVNVAYNEHKATEEANQFLLQYYGINYWGDRWGPYGSPSRIAERINQYREAGADTIIIRFASFKQEHQLEMLINKIVPML